MKKILTLIGLLATIAFFYAVPTQSIKTSVLSENAVAYDQPFPSIAHGFTLSQQFIPQYDYIDSINIYIRELNCDINQGYVSACILDENQAILYRNRIALSELNSYGWQIILSNLTLSAGETYYLTLDAVDTIDNGPTIAFYTETNAASKEELEQVLTYATFPVENASLKLSFEYKVPLNKFDYLGYYLFALFLLTFICSRLYQHITQHTKNEPCN